MSVDKVKVVAVHEEVRACFKGHPKSGNKSYQLDFKPGLALHVRAHEAKAGQGGEHWKIVSAAPSREQREMRNQQSDRAVDKINAFRESTFLSIGIRVHIDPVLSGYKVLDQHELVGNCHEMAVAAAFVVALRNVGTPWVGHIKRPGNHVFCLVNGGEKPVWKNVKAFLTTPTDAWVIDPWANICCRQGEYVARFADQMRIWAHHGKHVWTPLAKGGDKLSDPSSIDYLAAFEAGPLVFEKGCGKVTDQLPRALQKQRDAKTKPLPGANGRWSPDDDWE